MQIVMPQLGETVTEGTISKWHKAVGDRVAAGDPLFEIETDKTSMEVPAVVAGVLGEILVQAGDTVPVGTVVGVVAETAGAPAASPAKSQAQPAAAMAAAVPTAAPIGAANGATAARPSAPSIDVARPIDPFHGLRTPQRDFGKSRLPSGVKASPRARRLAA